MAQPFKFDIFGAPPADSSAGFAAFSQGMSNAANLRAQSGGQFGPILQVARDYQRFNQEKTLQKRALDARAAYEKASLAQEKAEMERSFGLKTDELSIARRNAELRERGLDLEQARVDVSMAAEKRAIEAAQARALTEARLRIQQQMRMMGSPQDVLGGIEDPTQRGATEEMLRGMFRELGPGGGGQGAPQTQQPGLMQQIVPGMQMPDMGPQAESTIPSAPGPTRHPLDQPSGAPAGQAPQGQGQMSPEQQRGLAEGLQREVLRRVRAGQLSPEQAEDELMRLLRAAGIR